MRRIAVLLVVVLLAPGLAGCLEMLPGFRSGMGSPGSAAADYLRDEYARVEYVILAERGAAPHPDAVRDARVVLEEAVGKPVQITVHETLEAEGAGGSYTADELRALERDVRTRFSEGGTAVIHGLYVAGSYENGETVGVAYGASSTAFFKATLRGASTEDETCVTPVVTVNRCAKPFLRYVERAVIVHEVGHILGLVNGGVPMLQPHEDPDHARHSDNPDSVMWWNVDRTSGLDNYRTDGREIPYEFDENDLADLRAFARG